MKLFEIIRGGAFWTLDALKGSPKRNHYNEIDKSLLVVSVNKKLMI